MDTREYTVSLRVMHRKTKLRNPIVVHRDITAHSREDAVNKIVFDLKQQGFQVVGEESQQGDRY